MHDIPLYDSIIIGGGQSGLAAAYFLRRSKLNFLILDEQQQAGGAWLHAWDSLSLFSPADASSLPGWLMPPTKQAYPRRQEVIHYLSEYEKRYNLPIVRPVQVLAVQREADHFRLETSQAIYKSKTVICATGTYRKPFIPRYAGQENFKGQQLHSADYRNPEPFKGKRLMVVGAGNSGAQILAEVSQLAQTIWVSERAPSFLPDEVDGRYLFSLASKMWEARQRGETYTPKGSLGDIVMVDTVKEARQRGVLQAREAFQAFTPAGVRWKDGSESQLDVVIWCTGFRPALDALLPLNIIDAAGKVDTTGSRSLKIPGLWLVGYGSWTGFASATLIGVARSARQTAKEVEAYLKQEPW